MKERNSEEPRTGEGGELRKKIIDTRDLREQTEFEREKAREEIKKLEERLQKLKEGQESRPICRNWILRIS